ncbi:MAG: DUF2934 domain-containing protein [Candidatus Omnitrophota bacterium]|jgi:hypothetical protein
MSGKIRNTSLKQKESLNKSEVSPEEVQKKAHSIWEKEGQPQGKDWDIWLRAEKEVLGNLKK